MLMLILKVISILCLVGVAVAMFIDDYNNEYKSVANSLLIPLSILFGATFLAMTYTIMG